MVTFKYKTVNMFFDADHIPCIFLDEIIDLYPEYKLNFESKSWDIGDKLVLSVADATKIMQEWVV